MSVLSVWIVKKLPCWRGSFCFPEAKIENVKAQIAMFAILVTLILFLPITVLPLALKTSFTSSELMDMGVYSEDSEPAPDPGKEPANSSQNGKSCLYTTLSV